MSTDEPPVELAALLVADTPQRAVDVEASLGTIDSLAAPLQGLGTHAASVRDAAEAIGAHLHRSLGFDGANEDYYDPSNSYLDEVIRRRRGLPLTLSVLYLAVARRAGVPMTGIGFPGHFFVRAGGPAGVYLDPFHGGRVLGKSELDALAARYLGGAPVGPSHLAAVDTRAIVIRMLTNLRLAHARRADHTAALLACDRLVELTGLPTHRRDRGMHALALRAHEAAIDDLEAYLRAEPQAQDRPRVEEALRLARRTRRDTN